MRLTEFITEEGGMRTLKFVPNTGLDYEPWMKVPKTYNEGFYKKFLHLINSEPNIDKKAVSDLLKAIKSNSSAALEVCVNIVELPSLSNLGWEGVPPEERKKPTSTVIGSYCITVVDGQYVIDASGDSPTDHEAFRDIVDRFV